MLSCAAEPQERPSRRSEPQLLTATTKKEILVSLRWLVSQNKITLREICSSGRAEIRREWDEQHKKKLPRVFLTNGRYHTGWVVNECTMECLVCHAKFGTFTRRHHCRCCGRVACHACSSKKEIVEEWDDKKRTRVCDICVSRCYNGPPVSTAIQNEEVEEKLPIHLRVESEAPPTPNCVATSVERSSDTKTPIVTPQEKEAHEEEEAPSMGTKCSHKTTEEKIQNENNLTSCSKHNDNSVVSDVTDPPYTSIVCSKPLSNVSPSLIRRLAEVGFDGSNNSSDEDDSLSAPGVCDNSSSDHLGNISYISASGSSVGDESAQRFFQSDSSMSPLVCSVSPIHRRQPIMRTPRSNRPYNDERGPRLRQTTNLGTDQGEQEAMIPRANRRKSIGEMFGFQRSTKSIDQIGDQESDNNSNNLTDVSASGSSLGSKSFQRYNFSADNSTAGSSSVNSLSPSGQDIVIHQTFHSPTFTSKTRPYSTISSPQEKINDFVADKENCNAQRNQAK